MTDRMTNTLTASPLVSFIITTYNLPTDMLAECLRSILSLSLSKEEREIILIDDGSDLSPLDDLLDMRDDIIYMRQANRGLSVARNVGITLATGRYVQFVDGDDYLIRAPYEHCLDIVRYHDPDIVTFLPSEEATTEVPLQLATPVSGSTYLHENNLHAAACMYIFRRQILMTLRFTPGILHEDEEFTPQLFLRAEKVYATDAKAYFYRQREGSITQNASPRHKLQRLADMLRIILHLQQLAEKLPESERVALQRRVAQLTMDYIYNTMLLTRSSRHVEDAITQLRSHALFPLPDKAYTRKYKLFRKMTMTRTGRWLLMQAVTRRKKHS